MPRIVQEDVNLDIDSFVKKFRESSNMRLNTEWFTNQFGSEKSNLTNGLPKLFEPKIASFKFTETENLD
jgi:hypothetical protein